MTRRICLIRFGHLSYVQYVFPGCSQSVSYTHLAYAINRSSTNGYTILWPIDTGYNDSLFYDPVSQPEYLAAYPETGYLLAASSAQSGAQIYFGANQGLNASWVVRVAPSK